MEKHDYQDAFLPIEVGERFEFQCENCGNSVECTRESMDMYEDKVCESCGSIITIYYNDEENNQEMIWTDVKTKWYKELKMKREELLLIENALEKYIERLISSSYVIVDLVEANQAWDSVKKELARQERI